MCDSQVCIELSEPDVLFSCFFFSSSSSGIQVNVSKINHGSENHLDIPVNYEEIGTKYLVIFINMIKAILV